MSWIKNVVTNLVKKYQSNDPFELATMLNIKVIYWDLHEEINGFYKYDKRNKYIVINSNLNERGQKYVCSHELGHAVIHPRSNTPFLRKNTLFSIDKLEVEANTFAVELLMDDDTIQEYSQSSLSIQEIGDILGVPREVSYLKSFCG